jgi:hypothetical protein
MPETEQRLVDPTSPQPSPPHRGGEGDNTAGPHAVAVAIFFTGEIVLSRMLYRIHLRDEPY